MKKFFKRFVAFTLLLTMVGGLVGLYTPKEAQAYVDNNIVTNVTNPSYGTFTFNVKIPAKLSVSWSIHKVPSSGVMESVNYAVVSGTETNTGNTAITKTVSAKVNHSGTYLIKSTSNNMYTTDSDVIMNKFSGTIYSNKFTWTQAMIDQYILGQRIQMVAMFAIGVLVDFTVTKFLATAYNIYMFSSDMADQSVATYATIQDTPMAGYSYQLQRTSHTTGYRTYLLVYNPSGNFLQSFNLGDTTWDIR